MNNNPNIALTLSGGGIRAMVFHLGVLKLLAERGLLERVERISTVSGGSLLIGLVLQENDLKWPSSSDFLTTVFPNLRVKLCKLSLQWGAARQLLCPLNWRYLFSRANLLALALKNEWQVKGTLADLPVKPEWSINGTTAENGKRFRFKRNDIGDYEIGYALAGSYPLSDALAVSAAFPGGFGPLRLETRSFKWYKKPWGAAAGTEKLVNICYKSLHLYDGGVYDNLGLEPFFDCGRGKSKLTNNYILVSDAGAPLGVGFSLFALNPFRLKRVADIMSDQSHALRVRSFHNYIQQNAGKGVLLFIGTLLPTSSKREYSNYASNFPTTLRRIKTSEFDRIAQHGYGVAKQMPSL